MIMELKFRCWNGEEMISPDYVDRSGVAYWKENSLLEYSKHVMLWTGLLDRRKKEIYVGDIVAITNPKCHIQEKRIEGVVVFSQGSFGVEIKKAIKWEGYYTLVEPPSIVWFLCIADFGTIEVIGNICKNHDLAPIEEEE